MCEEGIERQRLRGKVGGVGRVGWVKEINNTRKFIHLCYIW